MRRSLRRLTTAFLLCFCALPSHAQTIPPVKAKALDDSEVALPKPGGQQLLILVLGFSHKSGENCAHWGKRISADFASNPHIAHYQVPVLASAPSFVRPMILHGMRKGLSSAEQSHFVPVTDHEADWKKLVNFSAPDDPYILIAAPDGHVLWQTHGSVTDSAYAEFKSAVAQFSAKAQT